MYPECRYVRPSGRTCDSPALKGSYWCYYHNGIQQRQTIRHSRRRADGRFTALPAPQPESHAIATIDYGTLPVAAPAEGASHFAPLDLPPLEDTSSIQFALTEIVQALAANELDPKRAGLLLYALQVASANVQKIHISRFDSIRTVTYTDDGTPLAPQDYGYDTEDYEDEEEEEIREPIANRVQAGCPTSRARDVGFRQVTHNTTGERPKGSEPNKTRRRRSRPDGPVRESPCRYASSTQPGVSDRRKRTTQNAPPARPPRWQIA